MENELQNRIIEVLKGSVKYLDRILLEDFLLPSQNHLSAEIIEKILEEIE